MSALKERPGKSDEEKKGLKLSSIAEKLTAKRHAQHEDSESKEEEEKEEDGKGGPGKKKAC